MTEKLHRYTLFVNFTFSLLILMLLFAVISLVRFFTKDNFIWSHLSKNTDLCKKKKSQSTDHHLCIFSHILLAFDLCVKDIMLVGFFLHIHVVFHIGSPPPETQLGVWPHAPRVADSWYRMYNQRCVTINKECFPKLKLVLQLQN